MGGGRGGIACSRVGIHTVMGIMILSRAFRGELSTNDPGEENAVEMLKEVMKKG